MDADTPRREGPWVALCLTAFGLGLSPVMPGTVASLGVALVLWLLPGSTLAFVVLAVAAAIAGTWATLRFAGRVADARGHGDPGWVVSDEVAGQALACLGALPAVASASPLAAWPALLGSFVLFRALDIAKPGPVGRMERLPGALGVLLDDVVAGAIAAPVAAAGWWAWSAWIA